MSANTNAQIRWKFLSQSLRARKRCSNPADATACQISARNFCGFDLLRKTKETINGDEWMKIAVPHRGSVQSRPNSLALPEVNGHSGCQTDDSPPEKQLYLKCSPAMTTSDIFGFDNTGNICIWPAEEILAFYCLLHWEEFSGARICELGGGMTCLAANMVAATSETSHVILTDGNAKCVQNCEEIVKRNKSLGLYSAENICVRCLRWDALEDYQDLMHSVDLVIAADCIFVEKFHQALVRCIYDLLNDKGYALLFSPRRGTALQSFIQAASSEFIVQVMEKYDDMVSDRHRLYCNTNNTYIPDLHYPLLIKLHKTTASP
ncbi:calmodulin-lysine N-methyltransferase-like [Paramacrobiotus metropolitanus]|uniref:calmodulin-lysine N-methyltransferase-like n=1 Tax=Paramacrobiotus metropolitanus TaxID=2943436 RepID=UPI00244631A8|nr:calmodulin-lysine N-methyltransferase-like [Paramacrobiotus metropolitanus]